MRADDASGSQRFGDRLNPASSVRPRGAFGTLFALVLLVAACSDDGGGDAAGSLESESAARQRPTLTVPPGTDPEAVEPYVDDLLVQYGELVSEIVAEPSVAEDPDDPTVQAFVDLYVPGSEAADNMVEGWVEAGEGVSLQPYNEGQQTLTASLLPGSVETVSDDEVRFLVCTEMRHLYVGEEGQVTEWTRDSRWLGEGTAATVDASWRLESLDAMAIGPGCQEDEGEPG